MSHAARLPAQLGIALRSRRKELGLSQQEAAAQGGLQQKAVSSLENDPQRCTFRVIEAEAVDGAGGAANSGFAY